VVLFYQYLFSAMWLAWLGYWWWAHSRGVKVTAPRESMGRRRCGTHLSWTALHRMGARASRRELECHRYCQGRSRTRHQRPIPRRSSPDIHEASARRRRPGDSTRRMATSCCRGARVLGALANAANWSELDVRTIWHRLRGIPPACGGSDSVPPLSRCQRSMQIGLDDLSGPEIHDLLSEHLRNMAQLSPPASTPSECRLTSNQVIPAITIGTNLSALCRWLHFGRQARVHS
jgi:hypothetical protein